MAKKTLQDVMAELRQEREELRVRMHLAKAEAKQEWEELEKKWQHFESRVGDTAEEAKASGKNVGAALEHLGEELASAYRRIRNTLR